MMLMLSQTDLVETIAAGILDGLKDAKLVPAAIGHTSLTNMPGEDARIRWATDRARNIAQALMGFEFETGQ